MLRVIQDPREIEAALATAGLSHRWEAQRAFLDEPNARRPSRLHWHEGGFHCVIVALPMSRGGQTVLFIADEPSGGKSLVEAGAATLTETARFHPDAVERTVAALCEGGVTSSVF